MKARKPIIAIDGPAGAGKTTTARKVAEKLGFKYIDTGAMYRAVTLDVLTRGVDPSDEEAVRSVVESSIIELFPKNNVLRIFLNGTDVTERIRNRDVTQAASEVSALECVRVSLTDYQRSFGRNGGIVMEGRDIGTVVFPDADFKVYLSASVEVRVKRRFKELSAKGVEITVEELEKEIIERDRMNIQRALAPLRKAPDAIVLDTTDMTFNEQVNAIVSLVRGKGV